MSTVVIETKGLDKLIADMSGYNADLSKRISAGINYNGNAVVKEARTNHRWERKGGKLEGAITFPNPIKKGNSHFAEIYLDDSQTTTKNGKSYGTFIHEGTCQGYNQSPIAPKYSHSTSKSGTGWEADPFLYNAINTKWKMDVTLNTIAKNMKKKYERK